MSGNGERGHGAINEIWVWVMIHPNGDEGVPASSRLMPGFFTPLLGADEARVRSYEPEARRIAEATGLPLRLKVFRGPPETFDTRN